jgi:hypothetical protein
MIGEENNDMEDQTHNKKKKTGVLILYPQFSTCSQKIFHAYLLWTAFMHRTCFGSIHQRDACVVFRLQNC